MALFPLLLLLLLACLVSRFLKLCLLWTTLKEEGEEGEGLLKEEQVVVVAVIGMEGQQKLGEGSSTASACHM